MSSSSSLSRSKKFFSLAIFALNLILQVTCQQTQLNYLQIQQPQEAQLQAPSITPFAFNQNVQETQRSSILCTISSGDLPVNISWLKDNQLLTPMMAQLKKIIIKPDSDQSTLKFASVRLEHAGNYTCIARNKAGQASHSAQLIVHGEPRWLREPQAEPIVATRGQTIVIDCQTTGWPKPRQSWDIKTHLQSEFEPLAATGRISLAANGSLVIRNADKSDEANYRCKSFNGIGKGISWSTSLKVNVPAHFETSKQQTSVVRKQSQVQLRCDAHGDEPLTIEWYKNKQRLTNDIDPRYTIHNKPLQNGLISLLLIKQVQRQDNSLYECVTKNSVGKDRLPIELIVQEEPDNIQELQATQINSRSVTLMWTEPYDGRSGITNYMFQYKKVQPDSIGSLGDNFDAFMESSPIALASFSSASSSSSSTASVLNLDNGKPHASASSMNSQASAPSTTALSQSDADDWQQASRLMLQANGTGGGVKSITIEKLDPSSKYVLRALAINAIGQSKFSQPLEFNTEEEAPEVGPTNTKAIAINSTSILVSWDEIPKSKHLGRIHGYYVGYRVANSSTSAQNFVYKPYIINDLAHHQQQQQQSLQQDAVGSSVVSSLIGLTSAHVYNQRLETTINELRRDTTYEITVVAFNSRGSGPSSDFVICKTIEMEVPKPVKLQIRRESNESIFIEWLRDPMDQNPVDDYVLYQEKNSASQEWLQLRLPGNQTQYKAPGLKCGTRYQFYIIAHNKVGKSLPSEVVGASTSGALPVIPTKMNLLKMVNSTCLLVNLNSFQDNGCRIKTFTVRYRIEKINVPVQGSGTLASSATTSQYVSAGSSAIGSSAGLSSSSSSSAGLTSTGDLVSSSGFAATHAALTAASQLGGKTIPATGGPSMPIVSSEWITIRPKSNIKHQRANDEDRMEYLCDLNPEGEYTIHVAASNDVGRSEIEYTVLMSSDELRYSAFKEMLEFVSGLHNFFAYIPSIIVFLLAGLFLSLVSLILYTTVIKYYHKFVILHNQIRATRRAKQDEKRRRKLNNSRLNRKIEGWVDEYEYENDEEDDGDDEEDDDDNSTTATSSNGMMSHHNNDHPHHPHKQFSNPQGHYLSNIASSAFDTSSIDSPCNKYGNGACMSTASTESIHGRFQCLNSKQYVKMNEYSMLPTVSGNLSPQNDIYGTTSATIPQQQHSPQQQSMNQNPQVSNPNSLYYSTLRRTSMQTYLPQPQPQQQQGSPHQHRRVSDIYGYYIPPNTSQQVGQQQASEVANEVANSIFVPPQQIIYSAPNIRRQPVFL